MNPSDTLWILGIFFIFSLIVWMILWKRKSHFGLGEGPATVLELRKDDNLRKTYSNFKEVLFDTLSVKYTQMSVIASGGMGVIISAHDKQHNRKVAIKTISPKLQQDPKAIQFFFQECQAIQKMNHPNIIRIYESADEGFLYYTMEYLEGETLENLMQRLGIIPLDQIVRIGTQVARALQHCHSNGIVHRDIKPSNIFITEKNVCKILDFGVVKLLNSEVKETSAIGSPNYASPEQLQGGNITGQSDIYALGVCLYKMASAEFPYSVSDLVSKFFEPPKNIKQINPKLSEELVEIIYGCIQLDPNDRYDATTLWTRLRRVTV
jgi:serine/threonine-protein kinase